MRKDLLLRPVTPRFLTIDDELEIGLISHNYLRNKINAKVTLIGEGIEIKGEPSIEFEKMFPAKQPSKVVIKTKDGNEYSEYMEYPRGDPREPMTIEDLDNKFAALSSDLLSKSKHKEIEQYMQENNLDFNVINDKDAILAKKFNISAYPTTFIYDADGDLIFSEVGYTSTFGLWIRMWWASN